MQITLKTNSNALSAYPCENTAAKGPYPHEIPRIPTAEFRLKPGYTQELQGRDPWKNGK
jgi:hypothetical protein